MMSGGRGSTVVEDQEGQSTTTDAGENSREMKYQTKSTDEAIASQKSLDVGHVLPPTMGAAESCPESRDGNQQPQQRKFEEVRKRSSDSQTSKPMAEASSGADGAEGKSPVSGGPLKVEKVESTTPSMGSGGAQVLSIPASMDKFASQEQASIPLTAGSIAVSLNNPMAPLATTDLPLLAFRQQTPSVDAAATQSVRRIFIQVS